MFRTSCCANPKAMSASGLGCAKTPAVAPHVEISPSNCISGSQIILHTRVFDALLENCVFYILRMYEFLHSQGQTLPSRDFCGTAALPLKPDIGWRSWHVRKVPIPDSCSAANTGLCMTAKWNGPAVLLPCPKITLASAPKMKPS